MSKKKNTAILYQATIEGQCPSGKNAVTITRTGKRFPNSRFKKWRTKVLTELPACDTITYPVDVTLDYYAGDLRRRDAPGMIDAIWHVLEKADIVSDDTFLGGFEKTATFNNHGLDRENPRMIITLYRSNTNEKMS